MDDTLNVLVIEDSQADFLLVERHLKKNGLTAACRRVSDLDALSDALACPGWQIVLADYNVPHLRFEDGTVATIYDWKEDETPLGDYDWHIGGKTPRAFDRVYDTFFNVTSV